MGPERSTTTGEPSDAERSTTTSGPSDAERSTTTSGPSDAELITAARAGDRDAYGVLWGRHETAARNLARQVARSSDVEELVSESFYRVLRALDGGGGPDGAFRPYLLSTLRRVNIDTGRGYYQRVSLTDDDTELEGRPGESAADITIEQGEQSAAWMAWASLPDSSRTLLWHLIVEEETPAQIAPLIGTTPNGVSSRAVRAKERLRQAFLQQHVRLADAEQCEWTRRRVGEYVRQALSSREQHAVEAHLKDCKRCKAVVAEITDVNQTLKAVVAPVVLGGAAAGYLHAVGAGQGMHLLGLRRLIRPSVAVGAGSVAAVAGIAAVLLAGTDGGHARHNAVVPPTPPSSAQAAQAPASAPPSKPRPAAPMPTPQPPTPVVHRPAPTRTPIRTPTPTSTPTPMTRAGTPLTVVQPPAPPLVTSTVEVSLFVESDVGAGLLEMSVPSQWRITDVQQANPRP